MDDIFKIYTEQLRGGHERQIHERLSPEFLDTQESELTFNKDVQLDGCAYLAEQELVIHWNIQAEALIPCSVCNEKVPIDIRIDNSYCSESLENIPSDVFNFKELLRETILLEVPAFTECHGGNCPERKEIAKYLKDPSKEGDNQDEGYHPFADLDLK